MNRQERRAAKKRGLSVPGQDLMAVSTRSAASAQINLGNVHLGQGRLDDALDCYLRAIELQPDQMDAHNNLCAVLMALGQFDAVAAHCRHILDAKPDYVAGYNILAAALLGAGDAHGALDATRRALTISETAGLRAATHNPLLRRLLENARTNDIAIERYLTSFRLALLEAATSAAAADAVNEDILAFYCALARQCFINEYIYACTDEEGAQAAALRGSLAAALQSDAPVPVLWPVAAAAYEPLHTLHGSDDGRGLDPPGIGVLFVLALHQQGHIVIDGRQPVAGWRVLLSLLRRNGVMRIALYSERSRQHVVAARAFVAERGHDRTANGIRRFRQDALALPESDPVKLVARSPDFFSLSECRDLVFHVQEHRFTLPQIADILTTNGLEFLGFDIDASVQSRYSAQFPADRARTDLDQWDTFEQAHPWTFAGMYQFWVQKRGG